MTEEELDRHIIEATSWRYETDKEALENYNKFGPWFRCDLKVTLLADAIRIPIDKDYRTPTSIMKNLKKKNLETLQKELTEAIEERKASLSKQEAWQEYNDRRKEVLKCLS